MSHDDGHVSDDSYQDEGGRSQESAKDIMDHLLQSPSALEALGRGLLSALSPLMLQHTGPSGSQVSNNIPSTHAPQPFNPPWYPPFPTYMYGPPGYGPPSYGPPSYGHPFPYPLMGDYPYG